MKETEEQLRLQAYLDGELATEERQQVESAILRDPNANALLSELKMTRAVLEGYEEGIKLPEGREFYWSKIERGIHAAERSAAAREGSRDAAWQIRWRKWLMPTGALAALAVAIWFAGTQTGFFESTVLHGESSLADAGAFTYRDFSTGTTLVWLSYPAEN
jgi:anti-sigma factor RsiW